MIHLVEIEGLDGEDFQDPGEDALRVVRVEDNLQAAGEEQLVQHVLLQNACHFDMNGVVMRYESR